MSKRIAKIALVGVAILTLVLGYFIKDLRFNYVFEDFFPIDDPELSYYLDYREVFGNDNDYLLIGLDHNSSIYDSTFLMKVASFTDSLDSYHDIEFVLSPTNLRRPVISRGGFFRLPVLHIDDPSRLANDSVFISKNPFWGKNLISDDSESLAVVFEHKPLRSKEMTDSLINFVYDQVEYNQFEDYHIAGKSRAQGVFIEKMKVELLTFLSISIILVILFLAYGYKSWWGVIIPLIVVMLAVIWTTGAMGAMDKPLDILMVLLPTILFVVGMSDVVHIMTKYIEELRLGRNKIEAITTTFKEVGLATFLTSLTTAVGFSTLLTASIRPIREFGVYTAIGVFFAFIAAFTLMPSVLLFVKKPKVSLKQVHRSSWFKFLSTAFRRTIRSPGFITAGSLVIIILSLVGMSRLEINTFLIEDLPADDPLKMDFIYFDENFGGSRPFEVDINVHDTDRDIFDPEVIKEIDKVDKYLSTTLEAGNIVSPAVMVKVINQATNGGLSSQYKLPDNDWSDVRKNVPRIIRSSNGAKIVDEDLRRARINAKVGDIGSAISLERTKDFREFLNTEINEELVGFTVTGTSNLIDKNNEYLANNMFQGLGIAFLVVAAIAGIMFRSVRMVLITLIPNVIPLLMVAGIMGFFDIALKLSTSIVFTIAFGIAVDDTIHFISKFKLELDKGKSIIYALKRTYLSTGKAIIITSIILSGGFLTLILSSFGGTFYTGLLVSLTLVFALLIDLTLLPVLIMLFYRIKGR